MAAAEEIRNQSVHLTDAARRPPARQVNSNHRWNIIQQQQQQQKNGPFD
jgi:hypothetical protein